MKWIVLFAFLMSPEIFAATNAAGSKSRVAHVQVRQLKSVLDQYKQRCGQYPTSEQGLGALGKAPDRSPLCRHYPKHAFLGGKNIPMDPWGHAFVYISDGKNFTLTSYGRDGKEGGVGEDADVIGQFAELDSF